MKTIYAFCGGAAIVGLLAAAMFRNTTPVDQTFTYQGQLRNAGQLVNGAVDLKISMWDADTAGVQIGTSNTFNAVPMTDGRFALGLNFGASAFDGSNRWIQVEFRNPAGSGLYLALNPRDKITATPYALYALNGSNGVWVYDTKQQSVSVLGKKVGIGTSNPTAALEVVSATGGDDSVKLPAGSIGRGELTADSISVSGFDVRFGFPGELQQDRAITVDRNCYAFIAVSGKTGWRSNMSVTLDGSPLGMEHGTYYIEADLVFGNYVVPLSQGQHLLRMSCDNNCVGEIRISGIIIDRLMP